MNYPTVEWMHGSAEDARVASDGRLEFRVGTTAISAKRHIIATGVADVVLQDGRTLTMNGLFTQPRTLMSSPIAEQLGCALEDGPMGLFIKVDEGKVTSVPNVFACGGQCDDGDGGDWGASGVDGVRLTAARPGHNRLKHFHEHQRTKN